MSKQIKVFLDTIITTFSSFKRRNVKRGLKKIGRSQTYFLAEAVLSVKQLSWSSIPSTVSSRTFPSRLLKF